MALLKLQFKPTVFRQQTSYAAEGFWYDCDKIRFRYDFPQSIGGWQRAASGFLGVCRSLFAWNKLNSEALLGVGTHLKFYIERGTLFFDITPERATATLTNPINTITGTLAAPLGPTDTSLTLADASMFYLTGTVRVGTEVIWYNGIQGNTLENLMREAPQSHTAGTFVSSRVARITDVAHGALDDNFVTFSGGTAFAGLTTGDINKEFQIIDVLDDDNYYIDLGAFPTSMTTGGGTITAVYQIITGQAIAPAGAGWASIPWSEGGWGGVGSESGLPQFQLRLWSQQNFGEDLVFTYRGGPPYYWDASNMLMIDGGTPRAVPLSTLPLASDVPVGANILLITESRFLLAFGTNPIGSTDIDPMLIRWSEQELIQRWTPDDTNLAGDLRLSLGSEIVAAVQTRQEILVWTNKALYSLQFNEGLGFTQSLIADNISIAGPNAAIVANNLVYWMGKDKFYVYTGRSDTLPCTVESYVFDNINSIQLPQVYAGSNEGFDEVWWFYASDASDLNDRYVVFNYVNNSWYFGTLARTAWLDAGVREQPLAAALDATIYQHEIGTDDGSTDPASPLNAYIESADFDLDDGYNFMFITRMLPDIDFTRSTNLTPSVNISLGVRKATGAAYLNEQASSMVYKTVSAPMYVHTSQIYFRARGREAKVRIESNTLGTAWRLGLLRINVLMDGKRA